MPSLTKATESALDQYSVFNMMSCHRTSRTFTVPVLKGKFGEIVWETFLGSGRYGDVLQGYWPSKNKKVAMKVLHGDTELENVKREIDIWRGLEHPNLIKLYDYCSEDESDDIDCCPQVSIIMEYAPNGSLFDYIQTNRTVPRDLFWRWSQQTAAGLVYLHQRNIVHRDLKSPNIVLDSVFNAKLCDFGCCACLARTTTVSVVGSIRWMPPEVLMAKHASSSSDLYSFGMVLWEMLTAMLPFHEMDNEFQIMWAVCESHKRPKLPEECPLELSELIERCWQHESHGRPHIKEVLNTLTTLAAVDLRGRPTEL